MTTCSPLAATATPDFFSTQVSQARRFYLTLTPRPRGQLQVVCGGLEHCALDYAVDRASFPFYSIEFVLGGHGRLRLGREELELQPGSVFSYGPGVPHEIATDPKRPMTKYFLNFAGRRSEALLQTAQLRVGSMAKVAPPNEIQPLFDEIIRNGLRGTAKSPQICADLLEVLLQKISESRAPHSGRETLAFQTYQQCRTHIAHHFLRLRSVTEIAAECHRDETYLCRLFRRFDQETPYQLLRRLKMNHAAERLQSGQALVKHVAEETGYANPFHFSKVFKQVWGVSPVGLIRMR